ncbi:MAG: DNA polymerase III subunit beta [Thermoflexales bacterium]|nr:DNA polymerase III subunit beta [Thermoflexales bacterium]MDW8352323.1 DNA polymerase III subunit beta [Anaerolineae bacterium]
MRISCLQPNLARGLNIVSRAVASRTATLPILTHVLLATDNGRLKIAATNLELAISCWIGAKVEDEGAITVPARTFTDLVALLPADKLDLELNIRTHTLRVQSGRTDANIKGMDAQEFPIIPAFREDNVAAYVEPAVLRKMVSQVVFAAATDESRPTLTGVLTKLEGDKITMAATDGFRLSVRSDQLKEPVREPRTILIPAKALVEVGRVMGEQEEPVAISVTPSHGQVLFHMKDVDVVAQLIDQKFPDYEPIIPKRHDTRTIISTAEVLKACRQASIFARDSLDTVRILIKPGEELEPGKVTVVARADETGDNQSELEAVIVGNELEIGFNVKYLIEAFSAVDTPQAAIETTQPRSPAVIRAVGDDHFLHLVMPMHLPKS